MTKKSDNSAFVLYFFLNDMSHGNGFVLLQQTHQRIENDFVNLKLTVC